ncbi:hypothetical protein HMPREF1508_0654 [Shuttleworthella sp. MSX8B]|nr:hypothetical protein HMPREF1508_0654 [Shuttleworthia sp. MSX8B]
MRTNGIILRNDGTLSSEYSESEVILSDFDSWSIILLHGLLSDSEEEDNRLEDVQNIGTGRLSKGKRK